MTERSARPGEAYRACAECGRDCEPVLSLFYECRNSTTSPSAMT
ncbi:hypothetical protein SAMN05421776_106157 [Nocardia farcinica]|uniref:Uncharacterized protein n=1 Tax=Nocardia farcinica TaxID=37329 RepID=A0A0H5P5E9_NOCFR|nr:hypothetical protein CJ469_03867 [Nocardia farcinica]SLH94827.1 Uncharacterised protein [Mycobacteroides abscessus subsp. abscessus]PFX03096.1 hypothetical protein CJ468_05805 [Nocardia farcinica]CRY82753.1 Uncharacterised protein [Nocardia farcinica]SIT26417.1 hypothetical protein SAMN05421776_106157 [Nocardia farcinica]